jgi:hypothetical protein
MKDREPVIKTYGAGRYEASVASNVAIVDVENRSRAVDIDIGERVSGVCPVGGTQRNQAVLRAEEESRDTRDSDIPVIDSKQPGE